MTRIFAITLIFMLTIVATGCNHRLTFQSGMPYQTEFRVNDAALVALPDGITGKEYKVRVGGFLPWEKQVYIIPVDRAYSTEILSHLRGFFQRGVTVTTRSVADELSEKVELETGDSNTSEVDRILGEMARKEEDPKAVEKTQDELDKELYQETGMELLRQKDISYLVDFQDAHYLFIEGRLVVDFRTRLIDQRTGVILFNKRYHGESRRFEGARSEKTNENRLMALTREAFSGSMKQLVYDIAVALDAKGLSNR